MIPNIEKMVSDIEKTSSEAIINYLTLRKGLLTKILTDNAALMHDAQREIFTTRIQVYADALNLMQKQPPQYLPENEVLLWLDSERQKLEPYLAKTTGAALLEEAIQTIKRNRIYK